MGNSQSADDGAAEHANGPNARRVWGRRSESVEKCILFPDGSAYFGQVEGDSREGFGVFISIDNWELEGSWKNDQLHGKALCIKPDGSEWVQFYEKGTLDSETVIERRENPRKMEQAVPHILSSRASSRSVTPSSSSTDLVDLRGDTKLRTRFLASFASARLSTPHSSTSKLYKPRRPSDASSWLIPFEQIDFNHPISFSNSQYCSVVYHATWIGKEVAVRMFQRPPGPLNKPVLDILSRMARIRHPNIALFMAASINESDGRFAILTEYIPNGSLDKVLTKHVPLSTQSILHVTKSIGVACAYLRKQGFYHGNLRPANVLIDISGNVKLTDYFVKDFEELFHPSPCVRSTVAYIAPEALRRIPFVPFGVDTASDVYSFGMICDQILSGIKPLKQFSVPQIRALVGYGGYREPRDSRSNSVALDKLIQKCTLQNPKSRPTFERLVIALNSLQNSANSAAEDALITFISGK